MSMPPSLEDLIKIMESEWIQVNANGSIKNSEGLFLSKVLEILINFIFFIFFIISYLYTFILIFIFYFILLILFYYLF